LQTQPHEPSVPYEPTDRPVRFYELVVCFVAQVLLLAEQKTHSQGVELAAMSSFALLLALSLWKLLVPPRYSTTRCAFVLIGVLCLVLLLTA
jgi:hypothetical protein